MFWLTTFVTSHRLAVVSQSSAILQLYSIIYYIVLDLMEQCTLRNVNNCLNTDIYPYLETSGG